MPARMLRLHNPKHEWHGNQVELSYADKVSGSVCCVVTALVDKAAVRAGEVVVLRWGEEQRVVRRHLQVPSRNIRWDDGTPWSIGDPCWNELVDVTYVDA